MAEISIKDVIKREYARCYQDPVYFLKKYAYIQHPVKGKLKFNLYDFQAETLKSLQNHRFTIINKGRQLGISTLVAGFSLWRMIFHDDTLISVIATKQTVARNLVSKVRLMNYYLPSWLKRRDMEDNKLALRLDNGSKIEATASTSDAGRSEALSLLVIDEAAFMMNAEDIWTAAQSTLSTGGNAIIISTPNGATGFFYDMWVKAQNKEIDFHAVKLPWYVHPDRDQAWRDEQTKLLGPKKAAQENDCSFLASGNTVIDGELIQFYEENFAKDPIEVRGLGNEFYIFEYPQPEVSYAVVADVARGDGTDFSTFHVFDIEACKQVAEYKGKPGTTDFGNMLVTVATEYNDAVLIIENTGVGWAVVQVAIDREYKNLYYVYRDKGYHDAETFITKGYDLRDKADMVPGFTTSHITRPLVVSKLQTYFNSKQVIVRGRRTLEELKSFIWYKQKAQANPGKNDDLVLPLGIFLYARDSTLRLREKAKSMHRQLLQTLTDTAQSGLYKPSFSNPAAKEWEIGINSREKLNLRDFI